MSPTKVVPLEQLGELVSSGSFIGRGGSWLSIHPMVGSAPHFRRGVQDGISRSRVERPRLEHTFRGRRSEYHHLDDGAANMWRSRSTE